jgi:competence protein ComEA
MLRPRLVAFVAVLVALALPLAGAAQSTGEKPAAAATKVVNLNTATAADLESLPGIGARTAERILEYRQKNGSFKKIEELMNVKGIGEKSFLKLKPLVTVTPARAERAAASSSR